jgi:hypothetical protein
MKKKLNKEEQLRSKIVKLESFFGSNYDVEQMLKDRELENSRKQAAPKVGRRPAIHQNKRKWQ